MPCWIAASWLASRAAACWRRISWRRASSALDLLDLAADRREELLPLREAGLDLALGRGPRGDDLLLARASALQPLAASNDLGPEPLDLPQHLGVFLGHAVDRVQPVDEILEARAAQEDLERRRRVTADVEVAQPAGQAALGDLEVPARDADLAVVRPQVGLDRVELDRGGVVRLDRLPELRVERLDVGQHALGFGLLVLDAVCKRRTSADQRRRQWRRRGALRGSHDDPSSGLALRATEGAPGGAGTSLAREPTRLPGRVQPSTAPVCENGCKTRLSRSSTRPRVL